MQLYEPADTDPALRRPGSEPPKHVPLENDLEELCGLVACMRAWGHTHGDEHDEGREHALYPRRQWRNGMANEGPLWAAIERVLVRHGYGRGQR